MLVRTYIQEMAVTDKHKFRAKLLQKNILHEFMEFVGGDLQREEVNIEHLEKFKDEILLPELAYHKKKSEEAGIPFKAYQGLLLNQVMNEQTIDKYDNDIRLFIDWCQSHN